MPCPTVSFPHLSQGGAFTHLEFHKWTSWVVQGLASSNLQHRERNSDKEGSDILSETTMPPKKALFLE